MKSKMIFLLALALSFSLAAQAIKLPSLKPPAGGSSTTSSGGNTAGPKSGGLTDADRQRNAANDKRKEIAEYLKTLHGTSFAQATAQASKKFGLSPKITSKTNYVWFVPLDHPFCVQANLGMNNAKGLTDSSMAQVQEVGYHMSGEDECIEALAEKK